MTGPVFLVLWRMLKGFAKAMPAIKNEDCLTKSSLFMLIAVLLKDAEQSAMLSVLQGIHLGNIK
jgi:hypothetical protein